MTIDPVSVASLASFMTMGMCTADTAHRKIHPSGKYHNDMYEVWGKGAVELHLELIQYALLAERACKFASEELDHEYCGVYEYEVAEPFGEWFTEFLFSTGDAPNKEQATDRILRKTAEFFTQSGGDDKLFDAGVLFNILRVNL
jgi:hypothetical protein